MPRPTDVDATPERAVRTRMTGTQRREQLIEIGRALFAERGYEATSIEEIAQRAHVSNLSSTNTSAARRASMPWSWIGRCRGCWRW